MEMTRQEALELLELQESASAEEIQQKYLGLYNEYKFRITNAPTNNLKKTYNEKLEQLEQAFLQLCPDTSIDDLQGINLPTDSPIIQIPSHIPPRKASSNPIELKEVKSPKNYKLLLLAGLIFVISIAIGVYAIFSVVKNRDELVTTQQQLQKADEENAIYKRLTEPILENYKFRIENRSPESIYILWVAGMYNKNGKMESFDSYDYFIKNENRKKSEIRPDTKKNITFTEYDGEVGYYVFMYQYKDAWYWRSGFFANDQRDKSIIIEQGKN